MMMVEPPQDYAPDLNWLLQSNQTPPEVILEVLVHEFYPQIYFLAFSLLDDRSAALNTANEIFARAILERHAYRTHTEASAWLLRLALKTCESSYKRLSLRRAAKAVLPHRHSSKDLGYSKPETQLDAEIWLAVDSPDEVARQVALLHYLHGWPVKSLSELLQLQPEDIQAALERTRDTAHHAWPDPQTADRLDELIRASLSRRWAKLDFTPEQLNERAARIGRRALRKGRVQRRVVSIMEVIMILFIILFAAGIIWGANVFLPEQTPLPLGSGQKISTPNAPAERGSSASLSTEGVPSAVQTASPPANKLLNEPYVIVQNGDSFESLAAELGVSLERLRSINRFPAETRLWLGMHLLNPNWFPQVTPYPATPVSPMRLDQRLTLDQAIRQPAPYENIWFDALIIDYGPASYVGPPKIQRAQIWKSADVSLMLAGQANRLPEEVYLNRGDAVYLALPVSERFWFSRWYETSFHTSPAREKLAELENALLAPGKLASSAMLRASGYEEQAGVQALVIDEMNASGQRLSRIWMDERTGFFLRKVIYGSSEPDLPLLEFYVRRVAYNVDFPQELMDTRLPWRGGYAQDANGTPETLPPPIQVQSVRSRLPRVDPPTGFDPAGKRLTFQFPLVYDVGFQQTLIELFADGYFLGWTVMGNPWQMICDRSDDGKWLAFANLAPSDRDPGTRLYWFDLQAPDQRRYLVEIPSGVSQIAFAPDNQRLAYFVQAPQGGYGRVYILDIESAQATDLILLAEAKSLIWSPDGRNLAMIARFKPKNAAEYLLVLDVQTGDLVYSAPLESSVQVINDWLIGEWGVEFPQEARRLDECAAPPTS